MFIPVESMFKCIWSLLFTLYWCIECIYSWLQISKMYSNVFIFILDLYHVFDSLCLLLYICISVFITTCITVHKNLYQHKQQNEEIIGFSKYILKSDFWTSKKLLYKFNQQIEVMSEVYCARFSPNEEVREISIEFKICISNFGAWC